MSLPVSKHVKHVPKHRGTPAGPAAAAAEARRRALRTTAIASSVAVAATGAVVAGGVMSLPTGAGATPLAADLVGDVTSPVAEMVPAELGGRDDVVSRSDSREDVDPAKEAALSPDEGPGMSKTEDLSDEDPRDIARALLPQFGFSADQFSCLDALYVSESNWRIDADNPTSSAYGIPQALTQLHDLPADYMTSAESQIRWGLEYIRDSYGTPCSAWAFKQGHNWY